MESLVGKQNYLGEDLRKLGIGHDLTILVRNPNYLDAQR